MVSECIASLIAQWITGCGLDKDNIEQISWASPKKLAENRMQTAFAEKVET